MRGKAYHWTCAYWLRSKLCEVGKEWKHISWPEALDLVSQKIKVRQAHGPDALGFLASAKCTNERICLTTLIEPGQS
jgi:predicted molibdopterin-dependent oxidoreductase YjgC